MLKLAKVPKFRRKNAKDVVGLLLCLQFLEELLSQPNIINYMCINCSTARHKLVLNCVNMYTFFLSKLYIRYKIHALTCFSSISVLLLWCSFRECLFLLRNPGWHKSLYMAWCYPFWYSASTKRVYDLIGPRQNSLLCGA